jgi:dTDP-4-dehydrorhamnose 3,5-epimerase
MKLLEINPLAIPEIKVVRFGRYPDERGYFTEIFNRSDLIAEKGLDFLAGENFVQFNESYSRAAVLRGLHFQWNPPMGKLVRTLSGRMVDLALDIRQGSPTLGKIVAWEMVSGSDGESDEWIWIPPGFAHGNFFSEPTRIEYLCTGGYNPDCESGINPLDAEIDWSLCGKSLYDEFRSITDGGAIMSPKDSDAQSLAGWLGRPEALNFVYKQ